jgi:hypothetical protein
MTLRPLLFAASILAVTALTVGGPASAEQRTAYLNVCQELVNQARAYEARANQHNQLAKGYQMHIENMAKQTKTPATMSAMDSFFAQYDENRALEKKFRELFREASEGAKNCMKSAE